MQSPMIFIDQWITQKQRFNACRIIGNTEDKLCIRRQLLNRTNLKTYREDITFYGSKFILK